MDRITVGVIAPHSIQQGECWCFPFPMGGPWPPPRATGLLAPSASQLQGDNRGFLIAPCSCTVQWRAFSLPGSSVPGTGLQVPKEYIQFSFHCNKDGIVQTAPPPSSFHLSICLLLLHLLLGHPAPLSLLDARTGSQVAHISHFPSPKQCGHSASGRQDGTGLVWLVRQLNWVPWPCFPWRLASSSTTNITKNKNIHVCVMEYYPATRQKEIRLFGIIWMNTEGITLSEVRQRWMPHDLLYVWRLKKSNSEVQRVKVWLPGVHRKMFVKGTKFQLLTSSGDLPTLESCQVSRG